MDLGTPTLMSLAMALVLDKSGFSRDVTAAKSEFTGLGSSMDATISKVKRGLVALTGGVTIGKLLSVGISFNKQIDSYNKNFGVLLQDTQAGIEMTQRLKEKAMSTPFNVTDLAGATQSLLAYGLAGDDALSMLDSLGDIALGDKTKLQSLATVFGQISMAGKLLTQDYKQLLGQGFDPLTYISKRTGESIEQLQDRLSKGRITVAEVTQAFKDATSEGGQFYKGAEVGATTFDGRLSTLKGTWEEFIGSFTEPITQNMADKIFLALTDSINAISAALFGTEEQSKKTRAELYGTNENGEIDPNANLDSWYERLINTWTDGLPETDTIVSDYIDEFTRESDRVKQAMVAALMDESNPLTEEQKQEYESGIAEIESMQARVAELLQKRQNGTITESEQNELLDYLAKLNEYTNLLLSGGTTTKEESPLERFINNLADKGVDAIGAVTDWIVNFINNWPTYQETIKGYLDTALGWFSSLSDAIDSISTTWNAFGLDIGDVLKLFLGTKGLITILQLAGQASGKLNSNLALGLGTAGSLLAIFLDYKSAVESASETPTVQQEMEETNEKTGVDRLVAEIGLHDTMKFAAEQEFSNAFWTKIFGILGKEPPSWLISDTDARTAEYIQARDRFWGVSSERADYNDEAYWVRRLGFRYDLASGQIPEISGYAAYGASELSDTAEDKIARAAKEGTESATLNVTIDGLNLARSQNSMNRRTSYAYSGPNVHRYSVTSQG